MLSRCLHIKCSRSECISVQLQGQNVNYELLWVGGSAEETSVDAVSIKDHDGCVDRRKRHLWTESLNQRSGWVGRSAEETAVDTECQSKITMRGWIGGRDIWGHSVSIKYHDRWVDRRKRHLWTLSVNQRSWWVVGSAEETSVDTECQSNITMGGWIGGRDICGLRVSIKDHDGWLDQRKRQLWTLQLQAEFAEICFGFSTRFPLLINCAKPSRNFKKNCGPHYLTCIVKTLSNSVCTCETALRQATLVPNFLIADVL
jgi:hypothetical protein